LQVFGQKNAKKVQKRDEHSRNQGRNAGKFTPPSKKKQHKKDIKKTSTPVKVLASGIFYLIS